MGGTPWMGAPIGFGLNRIRRIVRAGSATRHSYAGSSQAMRTSRRLSLDRSASLETGYVERLANQASYAPQGEVWRSPVTSRAGCAPVTPDESGRLFLSGLVATRARLRFTGRKNRYAG